MEQKEDAALGIEFDAVSSRRRNDDRVPPCAAPTPSGRPRATRQMAGLYPPYELVAQRVPQAGQRLAVQCSEAHHHDAHMSAANGGAKPVSPNATGHSIAGVVGRGPTTLRATALRAVIYGSQAFGSNICEFR